MDYRPLKQIDVVRTMLFLFMLLICIDNDILRFFNIIKIHFFGNALINSLSYFWEQIPQHISLKVYSDFQIKDKQNIVFFGCENGDVTL